MKPEYSEIPGSIPWLLMSWSLCYQVISSHCIGINMYIFSFTMNKINIYWMKQAHILGSTSWRARLTLDTLGHSSLFLEMNIYLKLSSPSSHTWQSFLNGQCSTRTCYVFGSNVFHHTSSNKDLQTSKVFGFLIIESLLVVQCSGKTQFHDFVKTEQPFFTSNNKLFTSSAASFALYDKPMILRICNDSAPEKLERKSSQPSTAVEKSGKPTLCHNLCVSTGKSKPSRILATKRHCQNLTTIV